jgi:tripartite ATP-independent transporter DctP family solute receptor
MPGRACDAAHGHAVMTRLTRRELLVACVGSAVSTAWASDDRDPASPRILTASDVHVSDYPTVAAIRWMGETIERESGGKLAIRVYPSGALGRENDTIDLARFGALDITRVNFAALDEAFPATRAMALPYVIDSTEHLRRAVDGAPGARIRRSFERRGLIGLALYDSGARCFYNRVRPAHDPRELAGLKIRVPPSDIFVRLLRAFGANPTPLSYGEVFSALQTRLIDGAENNWTTFYTSRQFEVARFWGQSRHSYSPEALLMSKRRFDALSSNERQLILEVAAQSVPYMRSLWDQQEDASRAAVEQAGVRVNEVDLDAFKKAAAPIVRAYLQDPELDALYRDVRAVA